MSSSSQHHREKPLDSNPSEACKADPLDLLLPLSYSAPLETDGWQRLLEALCRTTSAQAASLALDLPWDGPQHFTTGTPGPDTAARQLPIAEAGQLTLWLPETRWSALSSEPWLALLCDHLGQSAACQDELRRNTLLSDLTLRKLPQHLGLLLLLVDGQGELLDQCHAAQQMIGQYALPLTLNRGHLAMRSGRDQRRFVSTLRSVLSERKRAHLELHHPLSQEPATLLIQPLGRRGRTQRALVAMSIPLTARQRTPALSLYRFTQPEVKLVSSLIDGLDLNSHADRYDLSINTVRSQLRRVFAKTSTHRQSQLLARLLLTLPTTGRQVQL